MKTFVITLFIGRCNNLKNSSCIFLYHKRAVVSFLISFIMLFSITAVSSQICYAVSVNGEYVGSVRDKDDAYQLVEEIDSDLTGICGDDSSISSQVDISVSMDAVTVAFSTLKQRVMSNLSGVTQSWYLSVDGTAVGRADSKQELTELLSNILDLYAEDGGYNSFVEDTVIAYGLVDMSIEDDMDALYESLLPESGSENALSVQTVTVTDTYSDIPYATVTKDDDTLYPFQSGSVIVSGTDGIMLTTTETVKINGKIVSETSEDSVAEPAVNKVVANGTKEYSYDTAGCYIWPAYGNLTSGFGPRSGGVGSSNHKGIDLCGSYGQDIYAAESGTVIYAGWMNGYGYLVQIEHENGDVTYYAHNSSLNVSVGDAVYQGQVIAQMGSTGTSSANHCHFEIRTNGGSTPVNPVSYLP